MQQSYQALYAASVANSIGPTIEGLSFSALLTRVEIGHIRIRLSAVHISADGDRTAWHAVTKYPFGRSRRFLESSRIPATKTIRV